MKPPSGARIRWWAPVVAVVVATGTVVAVRAVRRRRPPGEVVPSAEEPPAQPSSDPAEVASGPRRRARGAALATLLILAVVIVEIIILVASQPTAPPPSPSSNLVPEIRRVLPWSPSPQTPSPSPHAPCRMPDGPPAWESLPSPPAGFIVPPGELGYPPCWTGLLGEGATLSSGPDQLVQVTTTRESTGQQPGSLRRETFRLHIEHLGTDLQSFDVRPVAWVTVEPDRWIPATASPYQWLQVAPERDVDQIVAFDLGDQDQLIRLRVSLDPTSNYGTAEWELTGRPRPTPSHLDNP